MAEQFRDLQLKQKERFKNRVAKLQSKSQAPTPDDCVDVIGLHNVATVTSDDLGLMTATQERENGALLSSQGLEADSGTSAGENVHQTPDTSTNLRNQVEQLQLEKEDLLSRLRTTENKVETLQRTLQEERQALGEGIATSKKIVELSKKNRILHAELAAEKNRTRQMEKQVKEATVANQVCVQESVKEQSREQSVEAGLNVQSQLTALQEQLVQSKHKTTEYRNQCQLLKQDLKLAHKVIAKEVGGGVTVSALLNSPSGWRGRSQQILTLQKKLVEMRSLLEKASGDTDIIPADGVHSSRESGGRVEARQKATLEKMERERRQNLETMRKELERTQSECARVHKECNALRARNKTLTEDIKMLKSEGPSLKRKAATPNGLTAVHVHALESRTHELEQENLLLKQQLRECEHSLQKLQQNNSRLSSRNGAMSLPLIPQQPSSSRQVNTKTFTVRDTLSVPKLTVKHENYTLREAQVLVQIAESERDKLLELTMTLQQRLDNAVDQLIRLKMEKNSKGHVYKHPSFGQSITNHGTIKQKPSSDGSNEKVVALEEEVAIQRDENTVLRETLTQLRQEKLDNARMFHAIMQDSKRMCVEMMRGEQ